MICTSIPVSDAKILVFFYFYMLKNFKVSNE